MCAYQRIVGRYSGIVVERDLMQLPDPNITA